MLHRVCGLKAAPAESEPERVMVRFFPVEVIGFREFQTLEKVDGEILPERFVPELRILVLIDGIHTFHARGEATFDVREGQIHHEITCPGPWCK